MSEVWLLGRDDDLLPAKKLDRGENHGNLSVFFRFDANSLFDMIPMQATHLYGYEVFTGWDIGNFNTVPLIRDTALVYDPRTGPIIAIKNHQHGILMQLRVQVIELNTKTNRSGLSAL